jgi:hypothetical protein
MIRFKRFSPAVLIVVIVCVQACQRSTSSSPIHQPRTSPNVFDAYLNTDIPPADGFDFPVGDANARGPYKDIATGIEYDGWRIATQFAENYQLGIPAKTILSINIADIEKATYSNRALIHPLNVTGDRHFTVDD